jgi:hypothetical protein
MPSNFDFTHHIPLCLLPRYFLVNTPLVASIHPGQFTQIRLQHRLRATPNEEEERFPAPSSRRMRRHKTGSLRSHLKRSVKAFDSCSSCSVGSSKSARAVVCSRKN